MTCDDGDECTKEVCLSGKCVFPQPQGCVPKANFSVKNMTVSPATGTAGTKLQVKVQMNNYGAKVPNVSQQVMFEIVVAQGESLAQGTTAGIHGAQMSSDLGAPNPTGTFATINFTAGNPPGGDKAYDRICARIIYPDDSWPADNVTCTKFTWTPAAGGGGNPP
ncbi:MAG: hypothetical protein H6747_13775 [Deltaproteobacteria bacterium]|nr:hypothetical protein [Deltaproteobacteria bacterium]